jgi:hypothetical protein
MMEARSILLTELLDLAQRAAEEDEHYLSGVLYFVAEALLVGKIGDIAGILILRCAAQKRIRDSQGAD